MRDEDVNRYADENRYKDSNGNYRDEKEEQKTEDDYIKQRYEEEKRYREERMGEGKSTHKTVEADKKDKNNDFKKLERSRKNKKLFGVCGGLAEYFNIDSTIVRLLLVLATLFGYGSGIVIYLIAAFIMPMPTEY